MILGLLCVNRLETPLRIEDERVLQRFAADHITRNPNISRRETNKFLNKQQGDDTAIELFCHVFQVTMCVYKNAQYAWGEWEVFGLDPDIPWIYLHWSGGHFMLMAVPRG